MNTQEIRDITPAMGTMRIGEGAHALHIMVHTGMVRVTVTKHLIGPMQVAIEAVGPFYTTATTERDGNMEALTDPRTAESPFGQYKDWR